jgi:hypothetical protein
MRNATRTFQTARRRRLGIGVAIGAVAALLPLGAAPTDARLANVFDFPCSSSGSTTGDFNADGLRDLAVGAPGDNLEQTEVDGSITRGWDDAGSINVVYSQRSEESGLAPEFHPSPRTKLYFSQNTPGVQEGAEANDNFGFVMAAGNFDGQGGDDLAVGVPGENNGRGAVQVFYSGPLNPNTGTATDTDGLVVGTPGQPNLNQFITQSTTGVDGTSEDGDHFGYALGVGFINGDTYEDLVIGVPNEAIGTIRDAGMIHVIYGSPHGLDPNGPDLGGAQADQTFQQGPGQITRPEVGRAEPGDFFGAAISVGQLDDGGPHDVAIGSPGEDVRTVPDGGGVRVLYSMLSGGLSTTEADFFTQQTDDVNGISETADRMGCALDAGDFDGDGDDDLAVGVPGEGVLADSQAGVVQILYNTGSATGISQVPNSAHPGNFWIEDQVWNEDEGGIPGVSKPDDRMGSSLASGDFDGDGIEDLAIGLPTELLYTNNRSGSVRVLYGFGGYGLTDGPGSGVPATARLPIAFAQSPSDLPSTCLLYGLLNDPALRAIADILFGPCTVFQGLAGVNDYSPLLMVEEEGDHFGASLAAADFDGNGRADLAIGSPGEDLGLFVNWLTEEEATIPDELLPGLLPVDEADDAGVINVVYGPFPSGTATPPPPVPDKQDLIYREGNSPLFPLRSLLHGLLGPLLQDNQIHPVPADPSASRVIEGDNFGQDAS